MKELDVKISARKEYSYPIIVGEGLLNDIYTIIQKYTNASKFLVVTNTTDRKSVV